MQQWHQEFNERSLKLPVSIALMTDRKEFRQCIHNAGFRVSLQRQAGFLAGQRVCDEVENG